MTVDILVIGATGFCGRHAARYVLEHPERSKYSVGLAARSRSKLASIKQAKVVLNCIGPFWHYGTPIVHACARNGVHYTPWIFDIINQFDYLATKTSAIIIPSCAVDSIPADAGVHLASQTLDHAPLGASTTASRMAGGAPGGTIATFVATVEDVPRPLLARSALDWALSPVPGADSPPIRLVYSLGSRRGAIAPFGAINRALVQRTAGLLELAHLEGKRATKGLPPPGYGPAFTYTEFMQTGGAISAFFVSITIAAAFLGLTFVTPLESGGMTFVNITASDEPSPRYAKSVIKGLGDPGTLLTAALVGESALSLLLDELPPLAKGGGVLTPITALGDNIIRRMKACDRFEITSGIVDGPDGDFEES
ncbi:NAD-P-binding protein [Lactarius indigo]|nr:NAD-P-binding protein [Lactarius indigo]